MELDRKATIENTNFSLATQFCFLISGSNLTNLNSNLQKLQMDLNSRINLEGLTRDYYKQYCQRVNAPYALIIIGSDVEDLRKEIDYFLKVLPQSIETLKDIKTPNGSYFTPNPLGGKGKIAFVYPGLGSAYVGLGRDIFQLFPDLRDKFSKVVPDVASMIHENIICPKNLKQLEPETIKKIDIQFRKDINGISECGISFAYIYTMILREYFKIKPNVAVGYSVGEISMMASLAMWQDPFLLSKKLKNSPLCYERLFGKSYAIRQQWNIPDNVDIEQIWESYTVNASHVEIRDAVKDEEKVFLTLINTSNEAVIAGDPESCLKLIQKRKWTYSPLNFDLVEHCVPTHTEYKNFLDLYTLPINLKNDIDFYSSASFGKIPLQKDAIAASIAMGLCQIVDFPKLVNTVYQDGVRIFIELAARNQCSNWINKILDKKEHVAMPVDIKGVKSSTVLIKVLSKLVSHRVPVNLELLYSENGVL